MHELNMSIAEKAMVHIGRWPGWNRPQIAKDEQRLCINPFYL